MKIIIFVIFFFGLFFSWLFISQASAQIDLAPKDLINQKIFSDNQSNENSKSNQANVSIPKFEIPQITLFLQNFWQNIINKISETFSLNIKKEINKSIQGPKYGFKKSFTILLKNIRKEMGEIKEIFNNFLQKIKWQLNPSPRY